MADLRIRDVSEAAVARLKDKAARCGQSLEQYVKTVLEREAMERTAEERRRVFERSSRHFAGRSFDDSTELIREDRAR
jgi:plasmid stability protein